MSPTQQPKRNAAQAFDHSTNAGSGSGSGEHAHATKRLKKHKTDKADKLDNKREEHKRDSYGLVDDAAAQLLREELASSQQQQPQVELQAQMREDGEGGEEVAATKGRSRKERKRTREWKSAGLGEGLGEREGVKSVEGKGVKKTDSPKMAKAESPVPVKENRIKSMRNDDPAAAAVDGKVSKSKKRKQERRVRRLEEEAAQQTQTQTGGEDDVELEPVARLSKREKARLKAQWKKGVPLGDRIEDPKDVDPKEIKEEYEDENEANLSADNKGEAMLCESTPLEDRIEPPPSISKKQKNKDKAKQLAAEDGWTLSKPTGGTFIDQDPIMTEDEKHYILATAGEVRVYSATTSLLVRSMRTHDTIVCCAVSKIDLSRVIAGRGDGKIVMWDWTTGAKIREWRSPARLLSLTPSSIKDADGSEMIVALYGGDDGERHLVVYALTEAKQARHVQTLLTRKRLNSQIQLHEDAGVVVASVSSRLIVGSAKDLKSTSYADSTFTWREYPVVGGIVSADSRSYSVGSKSSRNRLDIAVGTKSGTIHLYEDLLYKLIGKEKRKQDDDMPIAFRSLNWHRTAVNTVSWSRDGNYIISGGNETVLVIWQLDTNKQQFLPHLSTEIKRLVVSKRGSAYAMLLGDNSVMALSTADLNPTANIALLGAAGLSVVAAMHPIKQGQLLAAIPRSVAPMRADQATGLQTYDLSADMQIARQALTRNLTTTINVGPDGQPLKEPNVSQLQVSFDGAWLATVEEWTPPNSSLDALHLQDDNARRTTAETAVKFWSATDEGSEWALTNRVDSPYGSSRIVALVACPTRAEFATISSDGIVQTWIPRARRHDGVLVKGSRDQVLYNWHVSRKIPLNPAHGVKAAALAYAEDGSLLAASLSTVSSSAQWTSLTPLTTPSLDPRSIQHVPALHPRNATFLASAFVGPYLVTLSPATVSVYDSINATALRTISFEGSDFDLSASAVHSASAQLRARHHLAANPLDGTFALALNPVEAFLPSRLLLLSLRSNEVTLSIPGGNDEQSSSPLRYDATLPAHVTALLPRASAPGYVVVDARNAVREIRGPGSGTSRPIVGVAAEDDGLRRGLDALFGPSSSGAGASTIQAQAQGRGDGAEDDRMELDHANDAAEDERGQARPKTLEDALGWQTTASVPSVKGVFERVMGIFRKTNAESGQD